MGKVLCFGELLLRLSPDTESNWLQQNAMPVFVGGAELNVAQALSLWDVPVGYCTALPDNYLSQQVLKFVQQKNIDTSPVNLSGSRIGLYYLAQGLDMKNAGVIYDRAHSSYASLQRGMIDWDAVLKDITWFHFSAICPALSQSAADVCEEALQACRAKGITTSLDLNYRAKLWQYGKQPGEIMPQLAQYCDLIMGNVWAADKMLNIPIDDALVQTDTKKDYLQQAVNTSQAIMKQFPQCKTVANTYRFDHNGILYYTTFYDKNGLFVSPEYTTETVIDKVGSGDCYMAGLIYGLYNGHTAQQVVDFATTAAYRKLFIKGDATNLTAGEIKTFIKQHEQSAGYY